MKLLSKLKRKFFPKKLPKYVEVEEDAYVNPNSQIGCPSKIGKWTIIKEPIIIKGGGKVNIGKYCAFGWGVKIQTSTHTMNYANMNNKFQKSIGCKSVMKQVTKGVSIGDAVWIADNVIILPGVTIGSGAVIGAGAVVSKDVEPFCVVAGVPAKVIKKRFSDEIVEELMELKWWEWEIEKCKRNKAFFQTDLIKVGSLKDIPIV